MTKAVLPVMRAQRAGHIINLSSIGGLVSFAASGYYNATKFAVEGLSGALAQEVAPLGIKVTVVEPGPFRTDFAGRSIGQSATVIDDYAETSGARRKQLRDSSGQQKGDPVRAAQAIIDVVNAAIPPLHLLLGGRAVDLARADLAAKALEFDNWEAVARGADFPD
jgi:short-subunit dehydrogenase